MNTPWRFLMTLILMVACDIHPTTAGSPVQLPEIDEARSQKGRQAQQLVVYSASQHYYFN